MLLAILDQGPFDERDVLVAQVAGAQVVGHCACGCATVDLMVDHGLQRASGAPRLVPYEATVLGDAGEAMGGVLVFVADGYLSSLEVYAYGDEPIELMPDLSQLRFHAGGTTG